MRNNLLTVFNTENNATHLSKLKYLILCYNQIKDLNLRGFKSLEYLELNHNNIEELPNLSDLQNLVNLDISYNPIRRKFLSF